jgi:hypothetical protein
MTRFCLLSSVFCLLLASCAQPPTADHAAMTATNDAVRVCREYNAVIERAELTQYASLPATERTFALMHRETMSMIKSTWGKDECTPGTNQWDAWAAYYAGHAEEVDSVVGLFRTLGLAGAAIVVADNITDAMSGTTLTVNGDSNQISEVASDYSSRQYQTATGDTGDNNAQRAPVEKDPLANCEGCSAETCLANGGICP